MREGGIEKYKEGQFSLLPEDEERIRRQAIKDGKDPHDEIMKERDRLVEATRRMNVTKRLDEEDPKTARSEKRRLLRGKFGQERK